jgi:fructokinase
MSTRRALIDTHVAASTITFDPNIRPAFFDDARGALSRVESHRRPLGSVKASDEDMHWLDPHSSPQNLAARWLTLGPVIVVVTFGAGRRICDLRRRCIAPGISSRRGGHGWRR